MSIPGLDVVTIKILIWGASQACSEIFHDVLADFRARRSVKWNPPLEKLKICHEEKSERTEKKEGVLYVIPWWVHVDYHGDIKCKPYKETV